MEHEEEKKREDTKIHAHKRTHTLTPIEQRAFVKEGKKGNSPSDYYTDIVAYFVRGSRIYNLRYIVFAFSNRIGFLTLLFSFVKPS